MLALPQPRDPVGPLRKAQLVTTDVEVTPKVINLIKSLHEARAKKNEGDRADKQIAPVIKKYLQTLPEGEQEAWDNEVDPPIGVALQSGGGHRWLDTTALSDETVVWATRKGILNGINLGLWDALQSVPDQEGAQHMIALAKAVKEGGGEKLVLLPKRGQK